MFLLISAQHHRSSCILRAIVEIPNPKFGCTLVCIQDE